MNVVPKLTEETRQKLKLQIERLKEQMKNDTNDLDYETHLHMVKDLESILNGK